MRISFEILSLLVRILIINFANSSPNHERDLGDFCVMENSAQGICREIKDCDYAKQLIKAKNYSALTTYRCKFQDRISYVCCPTTSDVRIDEQDVTDEIEPSTDIPAGISKFKKALCENETPEIQLGLNIIGGEEAAVGEFPFIAAIGYKKSELTDDNDIQYNCGGSLIADDIVMTAAHCVNKKSKPQIVRLGKTSLVPNEHDYSDGDDIEIESIKIHPNYSQGSKQNDIALMKLKRSYNTSSGFIKPICLSSNDENLPINFTISGFGRNDINTQKTSDWLLKATVNEYPLTKCQEVYAEVSKQIVDSHFCAIGYKGADSCQGDSGGPLSFEVPMGSGKLTYLYGVVSTGIGCGSPVPGIYTKVNRYLDWIEKEMNLIE